MSERLVQNDASRVTPAASLRVVLLVNPTAGMRPASVQQIESELRSRGATLEVAATSRAGEGVAIARQASESGADVLLACGGDGTLNEAVNGLVGSSTALAAFPAGTVNVWAREVGIPADPARNAALLWEGERRRVDLGRAGTRYFLLMAGIGLDADVAGQVTRPEKRRWGPLAYLWRGVFTGLRWPRQRMWIMLDDRSMKRRVLFCVIGNTRLYGGVVNITQHAVADDGMLDVCLFGGQGMRDKLAHAIRVAARQHTRAPTVEYYRAHQITLVTRPRSYVQVDGDLIGQTPMQFAAVPRALRVVLPAASSGRAGGLFLRPPES
jgi:YegS/Rv2252/BmrU family lipid kinase